MPCPILFISARRALSRSLSLASLCSPCSGVSSALTRTRRALSCSRRLASLCEAFLLLAILFACRNFGATRANGSSPPPKKQMTMVVQPKSSIPYAGYVCRQAPLRNSVYYTLLWGSLRLAPIMATTSHFHNNRLSI